jgi:hypothetical protein
LNGKTGVPFSWPLVGNGDDTSGGGVIKFPMPFKRSMKVTVDTNPIYYHVTYRTFSDATNVKTFDPKDPAPNVLTQFRGFGVRDPKPVNSKALSDDKTITNPSNKIDKSFNNLMPFSVKGYQLHKKIIQTF